MANAVRNAWEGIDQREDPLTKLANRLHIERKAKAWLKSCYSKGQYFCLVVIDLDGFKQINDVLGHDAGDQYLRRITSYIRSIVQRFIGARIEDMIDYVGRPGGDEITILLPNVTIVQARHMMAGMERRTGRRRFSYGISQQSPTETRKPLVVMMQEADAEMYLHKQSKPVAYAIV